MHWRKLSGALLLGGFLVEVVAIRNPVSAGSTKSSCWTPWDHDIDKKAGAPLPFSRQEPMRKFSSATGTL
ncbi:hypothetical protein [Pyrococcus kukulkanii]|uniref:Uncharacterized protein n=1 Tax=Pyrococcus kukulkanii TaxID=1609559 RepID=A0A127B9A3_9EURY|nr:hypothetical protein [Pyrococcus kukulkanii]AMM53953.1 hypothetical protein TQ32_05260 [Pyrococcus kukulkanii]